MYIVKRKDENLNESLKKITIDESKFEDIFVEDKVKIMAVGTGKTYSCGHIVLEQVVGRAKSGDNSLLIISTMSKKLINGIVREFIKNLMRYSKEQDCYFDFKDYIEDVETFKNISKHLKRVGVLLMTSEHPLDTKSLESCSVILTNHAYFFAHGHSGSYNSNCNSIDNLLKKENKKSKLVFDEFDQFHRFGVAEIPMNYYVGVNKTDRSKDQKAMVSHAFQYCRESDLQDNQLELAKIPGMEDYYYNLPKVEFKQKLDKDSNGILRFYRSFDGLYDFKKEILDVLEYTGEKQYVNQSKYAKRRGDYFFMIVNEIVRCKVKPTYDALFSEEYDSFVSKLLNINEYIILRTQKMKVFKGYDGKVGEEIGIFDTPEEFLSWVKLNLDKKTWVQLYNSIGYEGTELYITNLILSKKTFNFANSKKYYVTATPSVLENLGYTLDTSMQYKKITKLEKLDLFVIQNKSKAITDINEFILLLKNYRDLETFVVVDKEATLAKFVKDNSEDKNYKHVNFVKDDDVPGEMGRLPSDPRRTNKNVTMVYQKGNQTQGTNYSYHNLMLQDCHCKISTNERIVANLEGGIDVIDYLLAVLKQLIQSTGRPLRGDYLYKSIVLFSDFMGEEENKEVILLLAEEMEKYGFSINLKFIEKDITRKSEMKQVFNSILKHVDDRHQHLNLGIECIPYTFDLNNLTGKVDNRRNNNKKFSDSQIFSSYLETKCELQKEYNRKIKDTEVVPVLGENFGVSSRQFRNIKKKFTELLDVDLTTNALIRYSELLYSYRQELAGIDNCNDIGNVVLNEKQELQAVKLALAEFTGNKKDTETVQSKVSNSD